MLRAASIFGLGAIFMLISPKLRGNVQDVIGSAYTGVQMYAPYSYVAGVLLIVTALIVSFNRGSQPR